MMSNETTNVSAEFQDLIPGGGGGFAVGLLDSVGH